MNVPIHVVVTTGPRGLPVDHYNPGMPASISVTVRLFASLREAAGTDRMMLSVPAATPIGALWSHLPEVLSAGDPPAALRYALNHEWTLPGAPLRDGDEVAFVLPVSGG